MISFLYLLNESTDFSSLFLKIFFCNLTLQNLLSYYPNMVMQWYIWWRSLTTLHLCLAAIFQMHTRLMYPNFLNHRLILSLYHKFHPFSDFKWILKVFFVPDWFAFFFFGCWLSNSCCLLLRSRWGKFPWWWHQVCSDVDKSSIPLHL